MARVAWLSAFWILYIGIPAYFGMFFIDHIPFPYYWTTFLGTRCPAWGMGWRAVCSMRGPAQFGPQM